MLNFNLSEDQLALQKKTREFAIKEILPVAWYYDENDEIPVSVIKKAFEAGIMNTDVPEQYGGRGLGLIEAAILTEEIAAACPGLATSIFDNSLGMEPLILSDNEAAKKKYLPQIVNDNKMICFATSEPFMGSDVAGIRCMAVQDGDDFILNGTKYWITNGGIADFMTVFATADPELKHGGICAFIIEMKWDGVTKGEHIPKLGQRTSNTVGIKLKNVRVPKENILALPGQGFGLAMRTFSRTRPIIGAFAVGAARSAMEYAIDYAKKRFAFGTKIKNFEAIQFKFAEMYQKVETSRLLVWKAAWEADNNIDPTINASLAKFYTTESALQVVNEALQICGAYGYTKMFPLEKLYRDVRLLMIYEGTSEVQRLIVGGFALKSYQPAMPPIDDVPVITDRDINESGDAFMWRCPVCGHIHFGDNPPEECPHCFVAGAGFKKINR